MTSITNGIKNVIKKFGFAVFAISVFASYVNAASISKIASRDECKENFCEFGRVGVGGVYYATKADGVDISGYAGYAAISLREVIKARAQFGLDGFVGGGKSELKGSVLSSLSSNSALLIWGLGARFGVNISSKDAPLFVNITIDADSFNANPQHTKGFARTIGYTGVALEGEIPTSMQTRFTYGASYGWIFGATYKFNDSNDTNVTRSISNYAIGANIGVDYEISAGISFYAKLIGKYQVLGAPSSATHSNGTAISYPKSNNFSAAVEIGFGF